MVITPFYSNYLTVEYEQKLQNSIHNDIQTRINNYQSFSELTELLNISGDSVSKKFIFQSISYHIIKKDSFKVKSDIPALKNMINKNILYDIAIITYNNKCRKRISDRS